MRSVAAVWLVVAALAGFAPAGPDGLGQGVTVAILDAGFRGWHDGVGAALPPDVVVRSFRDDGNLEARDSRHGIRCAAVIHAMAPRAKLLLANWEPDRPEAFLAALRWAKTAGSTVISCSLVMPSWGDGEGGGAVHAAAARILGEGNRIGDLLAVACAGNLAGRSWSGLARPDETGWHQWRDGTCVNRIIPFGEAPVGVELSAPAGGVFQLAVVDEHDTIVASAEGQAGLAARWRPRPGLTYNLRVRATERFHVAVMGGWLEQCDADGAVPFPADGPAWLAVGALDGDRPAAYSSRAWRKPEIWMPVPFRLPAGEPAFAGTSAAAPQAAGWAAAWWSAHRGATVAEVKAALRQAVGAAPGR